MVLTVSVRRGETKAHLRAGFDNACIDTSAKFPTQLVFFTFEKTEIAKLWNGVVAGESFAGQSICSGES